MNRFKKLGDPTPKHIVILRALHLGELLCTVPAFRALRAALPNATVTLVGLPWAKDFVARFHQYLDNFIEFPGFPGFPERSPQIEHLPSFITKLQTFGFDLALQMQGAGRISNSLTMAFGALFNAGFYVPGQYCPDEHRFLQYPDNVSEVHRHLKLMEFLGVTAQGEHLEFPIFEEDWQKFQDITKSSGLQNGRYVCIHPGSRAVDGRWPVERFASVADGLAARGCQIVLTGTFDERNLTAAVASQMKSPCVNLAGKTTLGTLAALISKARLLVCNDTGVSHIATALRKASLVLFCNSDPLRWAPADRSLHRIFDSAQSVTPQVLLQEADKVLRNSPAYAS